MPTIHERLKAYREQANIPQEEIARRIGVSRQVVSYWENGHAKPGADKILKLSELLQIPVEQVLKELE